MFSLKSRKRRLRDLWMFRVKCSSMEVSLVCSEKHEIKQIYTFQWFYLSILSFATPSFICNFTIWLFAKTLNCLTFSKFQLQNKARCSKHSEYSRCICALPIKIPSEGTEAIAEFEHVISVKTMCCLCDSFQGRFCDKITKAKQIFIYRVACRTR